ncbi:hypothetical protein D3C75_1282130 [compost metagenome]
MVQRHFDERELVVRPFDAQLLAFPVRKLADLFRNRLDGLVMDVGHDRKPDQGQQDQDDPNDYPRAREEG